LRPAKYRDIVSTTSWYNSSWIIAVLLWHYNVALDRCSLMTGSRWEETKRKGNSTKLIGS
jgi:hypothetical protein